MIFARWRKKLTDIFSTEDQMIGDTSVWRREYVSYGKSITELDLLDIITSIEVASSTGFENLCDDESKSGVAIRIDLSRGFTLGAKECLSRVVGLKPLVLFPVAASGDVSYSTEGRLVVDPRLYGFLKEIKNNFHARIGLLADPSDVISQVLISPDSVYQTVFESLDKEGISLIGLGCSYQPTTDAMYNLLWVNQVVGRSYYRFSSSFFEMFAEPNWNEPISPMKQGLPDFCMLPKDGIASVWGDETDVPLYYSKSFATYLKTRPSVKRALTFDSIVYSTPSGWVINHRDGSEAVIDIDEIKSLVQRSEKRIGLIVDPSDIEWEIDLSNHAPISSLKSGDRIRKLPYPYHYYLAPNSDIDWSRLDHIEKTAEVMNDQCGLHVSGSVYLTSLENSSVSWSRMLSDRSVEETMVSFIEDGLFDTCHGVARSYETVTFDFFCMEGDRQFFQPNSVVDILNYEGVMLSSSTIYEMPPQLSIIDSSGNSYSYQVPRVVQNEKTGTVYYAYSNNDFMVQTGDKLDVVTIQVAGCTALMDALLNLETSFSTADIVRGVLSKLKAKNISMPVFTMHGGGKDTKRFGMYATEKWVKKNSATDAIDAPNTPYYLLPDLKQSGVHFYNLVGLFAPDVLIDIADMLCINKNQDESESYIFRRLASRRYISDGAGDMWCYGKRTASSQGLAYNMRDLIERFHHAPYGVGCVLYTHFGHKVGNQASNRLGWNEELIAAWEWLAEHVHAQDCEQPPPFRIWVAPASTVLAYSTVKAGVAEHVVFKGDSIYVTSWEDAVLGLKVPGSTDVAGSWLHGLTFYVDDSSNAKVFLDGECYAFFTRNGEDHTGRKSITLVENTNLIPALPSKPDVQNEFYATRCLAKDVEFVFYRACECAIDLESLSLRNVTHWTFEFSCSSDDIEWTVSLVTDEGVEICCEQKLVRNCKKNNDGFIRVALSTDDSKSISGKQGKNYFGRYVVSLKVNITDYKDCKQPSLLTLRNLSLIRPASARIS